MIEGVMFLAGLMVGWWARDVVLGTWAPTKISESQVREAMVREQNREGQI